MEILAKRFGGCRQSRVMTTRPLLLVVAVLAVTTRGAQSQDGGGPRPVFEVASVKRNTAPTTGMMMGIGRGGAGDYNATNVTVRVLIRQAYQREDLQLVGAPDWIDSERYDVRAKPPAGATRDQTPLMLQALLAERFKLA